MMRLTCKSPLLFALSLSLSGCLVSPGDPPKSYAITLPAYLLSYADTGFTKYSVRAQKTNTYTGEASSPTGTLTLAWSNDVITQPFLSGTTIVSKMVSTLELSDGEVGAVSYFTQSSDALDQGSVFVHAFENVGPNDLLWVDTDGFYNSNEIAQTSWSPFELDDGAGFNTANHIYSFNVMGDCDAATCLQKGNYSINSQYIRSQLRLTTPYGDFQVYEVIYDGSYLPNGDTQSIIDIRMHCGLGSSSVIMFSGRMYIHPEVGLVGMDNVCRSGNIYVNSYIQLTDTNIDLTPAN